MIIHKRPLLATLITLVVLALLGLTVYFLRNGGISGRWERDARGVWVARGSPSETPAEVQEQQFLIQEAQLAYNVMKNSGMDLTNGPCLGTIFSDWVADIVHDPRIPADDESGNQCEAYVEGDAHHFIELSPEGEILRIL